GATLDQMIATGFHRNTLINEEGGTDDEQFRVEAIVDRVNTTGAVWLGLTLGCAQCHSHKYDPVTQREYYQLYAFFNNTIDHNQEMPLVDVPTDEQAGRRSDLKEIVRSSEGVLADYEADLAEEERAWEAEVAKELPVRWVELDAPELTSSAGASFERLDDGSYLVSGELVDSDSYSLAGAVPGKAVAGAAGTPGRITAVRIDALTHDSLPDTGPGRANNGNFFLSEIELSSGENVAKWETSYAEKGKSERAIDDDPATGWSLNIAHSEGNVSTRGVFVIEGAGLPISSEGVRLTLRQESRPRFLLGRFRVLVTTSRPERVRMPFDVRASIATPQEERGDEAKAIVSAAHRRTDATWRNLAAQVDEAKDDLKTFVDSIPTTMVLREREDPRTTHVQIRGDFLRKGAVVFPDVPSVLPPLGGESQRRTRLDLAQWLVDSRNPLTARVTVNRIWQRYFGLGLVETENDFGLRGSQPTHPQLLDWLASDFVRGGWRLKRLHRLIVTSATYRQSSHIRRDLPVTDPQNRLLARQSRFRLEAEVIRDVALDASGLLTDVLGGPGVFPPQPKGIYVFTQRDKQWQDSLGADRYRRGLYTFFWRSGPYPFLTTFDKTKANVTCTRRVRSNTPLQALTMANDAAIVEFARGLAARVLRERGDARQEERLRFAFRLCFGRSPEEMELRRLNGFFESQLEEFRRDSEAAYQIVHGTPEPTQIGDSGSATQSTSEPKLNVPSEAAAVLQVSNGAELAEAAAWTSVARVLMNLDEFVTRE
ncbi:MAG: DUF1549 and DUF1553 domain-containing protein, partial [Planctomycetes bacterium]|nr:DUF1549 and DUF1553 domain-containing protein [Planctomycetota bacterium]